MQAAALLAAMAATEQASAAQLLGFILEGMDACLGQLAVACGPEPPGKQQAGEAQIARSASDTLPNPLSVEISKTGSVS